MFRILMLEFNMSGRTYVNVLLFLLFFFVITGFRVLTAPEKPERHTTSEGEEVTHAPLENSELYAFYVCSALLAL